MKGRVRQSWAFLRTYWRDREAVGAVLPSGRSLASAMTAPLRSFRGQSVRVLEVGPGTGIVTGEIVRNLPYDGRLDLVEVQADFVHLLEGRFKHEELLRNACQRVTIHHMAVQDFAAGLSDSPQAVSSGAGAFDFIISGLPLNNFAPEVVDALFKIFRSLLKPGGVLSYFEYMYLRGLRSALGLPTTRRRFGQLDRVLSHWLTHEFRRDNAWLNVPPAWVHHLSFGQ